MMCCTSSHRRPPGPLAAIPGVPDSSIIMKNALPPQAAEIIELYSLAIGYQSTLLVADRTRNTALAHNRSGPRAIGTARSRCPPHNQPQPYVWTGRDGRHRLQGGATPTWRLRFSIKATHVRSASLERTPTLLVSCERCTCVHA